jgi:putative membrane protein insertion efficiency factor
VKRALDRVLAWTLLAGIALYRVILSPLLGGACRFQPTCSRFGEEAIRRHGGARGLRLTAERILRCRPGKPGGFDPVP